MTAEQKAPEPEPLEPPKGPFMCPKCHRPVDPFDRNARRDPTTRKWEHVDCRTKPRRSL
ncbi:MAG TPA: hypothetical protein VN513_08355 [Gemmatimonadales bacterium]|nr:hypothetical protein [Gemmatimonadales bacterium]